MKNGIIKKLVAVAAVATIAISMVGCGNNEKKRKCY